MTLDPRPRSSALSVPARRALGGLVSLVDAPEVRDLLIHTEAGSGQLWVDTGSGPIRIDAWQVTAEAVRRLAVALIAAGGRHLDELSPFADVGLGEGIRVHAVLAPIAVGGAAIAIRLPRLDILSFDDLRRAGWCSAEQEMWLREAIHARRNLLLTGGTGSGKTTALAALLELVPASQRIVTIEDTAELRVRHPQRVALETRQANAEGVGEVTMSRLLREALRMRPDRLVLGECRGPEVVTLLAALNTGHDGGAGTLHASRLADVPARLEALGALAGLGVEALARQVISAVHGIVHLERGPNGFRIDEIGVLRLSRDRLAVIPASESGPATGVGSDRSRELEPVRTRAA